MTKPTSVDAYIASAPKEIQPRLREIREAIKGCVPEATEKISYGMPYYDYHGRLAYFSFFKNHIGLYIPGDVVEQHQKELKSYVTAKATIRFPHTEPLPIPLVKKLVLARKRDMDIV